MLIFLSCLQSIPSGSACKEGCQVIFNDSNTGTSNTNPQMTPGFTGRGKFDFKSYPGSPLVALDGRSSIGNWRKHKEFLIPCWTQLWHSHRMDQQKWFFLLFPQQNEKHLILNSFWTFGYSMPTRPSVVWVEEQLKVSMQLLSLPLHPSISGVVWQQNPC